MIPHLSNVDTAIAIEILQWGARWLGPSFVKFVVVKRILPIGFEAHPTLNDSICVQNSNPQMMMVVIVESGVPIHEESSRRPRYIYILPYFMRVPGHVSQNEANLP